MIRKLILLLAACCICSIGWSGDRDRNCKDNDVKVLVCHHPDKHREHTHDSDKRKHSDDENITIATSALSSHLKHGDTLGACNSTPPPTGCDDGNNCTNDVTIAGICSHYPVNCNDGDACTTDTCDPTTGACQYSETVCDDDNLCTMDVCSPMDGVCNFAPMICEFGCTAGVCDINPCDGITCDPKDDCHSAGVCIVELGLPVCPLGPPKEGPCNAGNACTSEDFCQAGVCTAGFALKNCDDGNLCTTDICDPTSGCKNDFNTDPCNDGNACTTGDICGGGICNPGGPTNCDDGSICTDDSCDPTIGCVATPNTSVCDDGNACTINDGCSNAVCIGQVIDFNDNNLCTDDSCDSLLGPVHVNNTVSCNDNNTCTSNDACNDGTCTAIQVPPTVRFDSALWTSSPFGIPWDNTTKEMSLTTAGYYGGTGSMSGCASAPQNCFNPNWFVLTMDIKFPDANAKNLIFLMNDGKQVTLTLWNGFLHSSYWTMTGTSGQINIGSNIFEQGTWYKVKVVATAQDWKVYKTNPGESTEILIGTIPGISSVLNNATQKANIYFGRESTTSSGVRVRNMVWSEPCK